MIVLCDRVPPKPLQAKEASAESHDQLPHPDRTPRGYSFIFMLATACKRPRTDKLGLGEQESSIEASSYGLHGTRFSKSILVSGHAAVPCVLAQLSAAAAAAGNSASAVTGAAGDTKHHDSLSSSAGAPTCQQAALQQREQHRDDQAQAAVAGSCACQCWPMLCLSISSSPSCLFGQ